MFKRIAIFGLFFVGLEGGAFALELNDSRKNFRHRCFVNGQILVCAKTIFFNASRYLQGAGSLSYFDSKSSSQHYKGSKNRYTCKYTPQKVGC